MSESIAPTEAKIDLDVGNAGPLTIGFVQREIDTLTSAMNCEEMESAKWKALWLTRQALLWSLEPMGFAAPSVAKDSYSWV